MLAPRSNLTLARRGGNIGLGQYVQKIIIMRLTIKTKNLHRALDRKYFLDVVTDDAIVSAMPKRRRQRSSPRPKAKPATWLSPNLIYFADLFCSVVLEQKLLLIFF